MKWVLVPLVLLVHDWKQPSLDGWYGGLQRPQGGSCCSRTDCHTTEAELRDGQWWARLGRPDGKGEWAPLDFVKVPSEVVLQHNNPTGDAVICHSLDWVENRLDPKTITIWCFIPPMET